MQCVLVLNLTEYSSNSSLDCHRLLLHTHSMLQWRGTAQTVDGQSTGVWNQRGNMFCWKTWCVSQEKTVIQRSVSWPINRTTRKSPRFYPIMFLVYTDRKRYVPMAMNRRFDIWKKTHTHTHTHTEPVAGRRREHGGGRPRQSRERRIRWGTSCKYHTEWWTLISSY